MNKSLIAMIQEDDPSYDPLALALKKTPFVGFKLWQAACDRVYYDGYYGPINNLEWEEQDGRKPYSVKEAIRIIARVLANVEDVWEFEYCDTIQMQAEFDESFEWDSCENCKGHRGNKIASAEDIRADLVPFYREIYGVGYPHV